MTSSWRSDLHVPGGTWRSRAEAPGDLPASSKTLPAVIVRVGDMNTALTTTDDIDTSPTDRTASALPDGHHWEEAGAAWGRRASWPR